MPVFGGLFHGLADQRAGRTMNHRIHALQGAGRVVDEIALDEGCFWRDSVAVTGRQVVEDDDVVSTRDEFCGTAASDIAGPTGNEHPHSVTSMRMACALS